MIALFGNEINQFNVPAAVKVFTSSFISSSVSPTPSSSLDLSSVTKKS